MKEVYAWFITKLSSIGVLSKRHVEAE